MPIFKVAIEKSVSFQGRGEKFSNVYTVKHSASQTDAELEAMADQLVSIERNIFDASTSYISVKVWDVGLSPNYMRVSKPLSGVGTLGGTAASAYRECAVLLRYQLPRRQGLRKTVNRELRKFLHTGSTHGVFDVTGAGTAGSVPAGNKLDAYRTQLLNLANTWQLCAPNGDVPIDGGKYYGWLDHRQFPRGKKEKRGII